MHTPETRNQFLHLRVQGWSFNRISSQIGVSKPTLIAWNRSNASEITALRTAQQTETREDLLAVNKQHIAFLTKKLDAIRQELLSRELERVPTRQLESLASERFKLPGWDALQFAAEQFL